MKILQEIDDIFKQQEIELKAARQEKEEVQQREKEALRQQKDTLYKFAKFLIGQKKPIEEIKKQTGLSEKEILDLSI